MDIPSTNEFDQETARRLLRECATLVVCDFPNGSEFGIDLSINYTLDQFMGIKMIPAGVHFVHYSLVNRRDTAVAPRRSLFRHFHAGEVVVYKWRKETEEIVVDEDEEQVQRIIDSFNNGHLDKRLGAYQFDKYSTWQSLSDYINSTIVNNLNPISGRIDSASTLHYEVQVDNKIVPSVDHQGVPKMVPTPDSVIRYRSNAPRHFLYPPTATASEVTVHSMDSSYTLETVLSNVDNSTDQLLGELQYAFIAFLLGQQYEAFEYWRSLVRVICFAQQALPAHADFYMAFLRVIHFQLKQADDAVFADIVENENIVFQCLRQLLENVVQMKEELPDTLVTRVEKFAESLKKSFGWCLDDEDCVPDDEMPVVVEM